MKDDTISRQGVLRLLNAVPSEEFATKAMLISGVNALPSAQPEKRTETHACDYIERQAAIDALNGNITVTGEENAKAVQKYIRSVSLKIHDLPSARPELIEKAAYIRGFEQGRTQGMIDSQGGKK